MRVNIFSCLLAFILGCNVTAEILHEIVKEKTSATLRCPHSVEGNVIWSRESHGNKVDILTVSGDGELKHIHDPGKLYSSLPDKSLVIRRITISDSGRYLCNNEPAVELTVIPSGTFRVDATEGNKAPPATTSAPTATTAPSMTTAKKKRQNRKHGEKGKKRGRVTPTPPPPPTTTTKGTTESTSTANTVTPYLRQMCVRTVIGILYLIIMISITVTTWRKARQIATTATENDL